MNTAHLHLLVNHLPVAGIVFAIPLFVAYFLLKSDGYLNAALIVVVLSGVFAIPTFFSGEGAEHVVEKRVGFSEQLVEEHEEAAELAIWIIGATAVGAAVSLYLSVRRKAVPKILVYTIVLMSVVSLIALGRTNNLGGKISHPEIGN